MSGDEGLKLALPVTLGFHQQPDVGTIKTEYELLDPAAKELRHNVIASHLVGRGRQCGYRHAGKDRCEVGEGCVFRAE